jgi:hypothetical protein
LTVSELDIFGSRAAAPKTRNNLSTRTLCGICSFVAIQRRNLTVTILIAQFLGKQQKHNQASCVIYLGNELLHDPK